MSENKEIWECSRCGATEDFKCRTMDAYESNEWTCDGQRYWHKCDDITNESEHSSWPAVLKYRDCGNIMTGQTGNIDNTGQWTTTTNNGDANGA
jgi:hypothetical protein